MAQLQHARRLGEQQAPRRWEAAENAPIAETGAHSYPRTHAFSACPASKVRGSLVAVAARALHVLHQQLVAALQVRLG